VRSSEAALDRRPRQGRHAVVVFGCAVLKDGTPSPALQRRLERALEAALADPAALVVVSGGAVASDHPEGRVMRDWLVARGIPPQRIVVEDQARFTLENAELVAPLLQRAGVGEVTLVTERFHMLRSAHLLQVALVGRGLTQTALNLAPADDRLAGRALVERAVREAKAFRRDVVNQLGVRLRELV
jgi:uncharacterized SAM-binding protein YcdF (DUF218 family)